MKLNSVENLANDNFLRPYQDLLLARQKFFDQLENRLTCGKISLEDFASGHEYFGLHKKDNCWVFREWAPNAREIYLSGDFSNWENLPQYKLKSINNGVWELVLPLDTLHHTMHYSIFVVWENGSGYRIPAYARRVVQDKESSIFTAQVWDPSKKYIFVHSRPKDIEEAFIYEAHIGMASNEEKIASFEEFRINILPRIAKNHYNVLQIMAVMEHPYYASFGYHVANFFAVSSRFGTPEEFKHLVDDAHALGLRVIIDLVHSHSVKNQAEGLGCIDGSSNAYFHEGERGKHSTWDSLCFDYGKTEVLHFLLSNCRYFLDEFNIDGFRFDGVTSMLYRHHGIGKVFTSYEDYFSKDVDIDALAYLALANKLIHSLRPDALTIAEDVSGMPGLAAKSNQNNVFQPGAINFDLRMAMGVSDMWFKLFDLKDEDWDCNWIFNELVNRRKDEHSISYVECHDQSIVGGKSSFFTLAGSSMYEAMDVNCQNLTIDRAMAIFKLSRLITCATSDAGFLDFMGNEFGHPDWVDFPREGNDWSFDYALRKWHLADNENLKYHCLMNFTKAMLALLSNRQFYQRPVQVIKIDCENKVIVFERNNLYFCFNFHHSNSLTSYCIEVAKGKYYPILDSDDKKFGGFDLRDKSFIYEPWNINNCLQLRLYLPSRTALVLERKFEK